jgi:RNA polymerase sigma-54 factor
MLKQEQIIKQQQRLSPLQYQVIKMLEYPAVDMEGIITRELEENPALEECENNDIDSDLLANEQNENDGFLSDNNSNDVLSDDLDIMEKEILDINFDYISTKYNNYEDVQSAEVSFSDEQTFREFLLNQLSLIKEDKKIIQYAQYLIGNINEDGYLQREIEDMIDDLAFQTGIEAEDADMARALLLVQSLDPAGVGACSLQECLLLQLRRKEQTPSVRLAEKIIAEYCEHFSKRNYAAIMRRLTVSREQLKAAKEEIVKLNPKPGSAFVSNSEIASAKIIPDFIVEEENGNLYVSLNNSNLPQLRVSNIYKKMAADFLQPEEKKNRQAADFVKRKMDSARGFIEAIKQRNMTLLKTMIAITKWQRQFFLTGDASALRPMRLKNIADAVEYDISTISRVSNSKYVQTRYGVFPLKYFFSESVKTKTGENVSNKEIQHIIKQLINNENKLAPITDEMLMEMLNRKGYIIARRTVAKYRDQLGIPSTHKRMQAII